MTVKILYTGGTIGSAGEPLDTLPGPEFAERFDRLIRPHLPDAFRDIGLEWTDPTLDSTEMRPVDWLSLSRRVAGMAAERIVLLHGTDTMAWSAAAMALLLQDYDRTGRPISRLGKRIAITGSQRPLMPKGPLDPGSDGLSNLLQALNSVPDDNFRTAICFGGETVEAARAIKFSSIVDAAFTMPNGKGQPIALPETATLALSDQIAPHFGTRQILTITTTPGADHASQIRAALSDRIGAIHLLGFGIGNMPAAATLAPALEEARARGILTVIGTQAPHGPVDPGTYAVGDWMGALGVLPAGDMTIPATQVKLHLAMALAAVHGWDSAALAAFFTTNVAGELGPARG